METPLETSLFFLATLAMQFIFLARLLYLATARCQDIRSCLGRWKSCPRRVAASWRARKRSIQEQLIASDTLQTRVSIARTCIYLFGTFMLVVIATMQHNELRNLDRWMTSAGTWTNVGLLAVFTFGLLFPCAVQPATLSFWYGVIMLFGVSFLSPWHTTPNQAFTFNFFLVVFFRVPGAILCTRLIWALLFNFLYLAMMTTRVLTESEDFPPTLKPDVVIISECLICTLVLVCTMALHGLLSRRAEMNLHRKNANTQLSAAQSLLRLTCDAVVELDGDLCLTKHCPELAAMLLKGRCNLEGKKLTEFMPPMEVLRAEENLRRFSDNDPEPAQAFHTRLVDSISSRLCIELFQVQYKEMDGRHCHLVGIRDFTDSPGLLAANSEMSLADPFEEPLRWQSSVPFVEVDVESTSTASASSGGEEPRGAKKVFLEIDMTDMRVQAASAPVDAVVGLTVSELFPAPHTTHLLQRLQHEAIAAEGRGEPLRGNSFVYKALPVCFSPGKTTEISGSMQVLKTNHGPKSVLLSFDEPRVRSQTRSSRSSTHSTKSQGTPAQPTLESLAPATTPL